MQQYDRSNGRSFSFLSSPSMILYAQYFSFTEPYRLHNAGIFVFTQCTLLGHRQPVLVRPRVVSRALGCGTRRGGRVYSWRRFGLRPGSVTHALGVQCRTSWLLFTGSLSAEPESSGTKETHTNQQKNMNNRCGHALMLCATARTSPGRLVTSHFERGRLATSYFGPHRVQQQSHFELISSCRGAFVRVIEDDKWIYPTAVQLVSLREYCCEYIYCTSIEC